MKRFLIAVLWSLLFCCGLHLTASAQNPTPNTTPGAVTRVILLHINQGKGDAFWEDVRKNLKPTYEAFKTGGVIADYGFATKSTRDSADDWDVAITLTYKNWAAFDDLNSKTDPITLKIYGSAAARSAAGLKRGENATQVASFLIRQQTVNDWK
jgi:hypothetical protein